MVLYMSVAKGGKTEKTNWVMHQYHLGTEEDEKDGEYVISKIFYQQHQVKQGDKNDQDVAEVTDAVNAKVDPLTPKSVTPDPPRGERRHSDDADMGAETIAANTDPYTQVHLRIIFFILTIPVLNLKDSSFESVVLPMKTFPKYKICFSNYFSVLCLPQLLMLLFFSPYCRLPPCTEVRWHRVSGR